MGLLNNLFGIKPSGEKIFSTNMKEVFKESRINPQSDIYNVIDHATKVVFLLTGDNPNKAIEELFSERAVSNLGTSQNVYNIIGVVEDTIIREVDSSLKSKMFFKILKTYYHPTGDSLNDIGDLMDILIKIDPNRRVMATKLEEEMKRKYGVSITGMRVQEKALRGNFW